MREMVLMVLHRGVQNGFATKPIHIGLVSKMRVEDVQDVQDVQNVCKIEKHCAQRDSNVSGIGHTAVQNEDNRCPKMFVARECGS